MKSRSSPRLRFLFLVIIGFVIFAIYTVIRLMTIGDYCGALPQVQEDYKKGIWVQPNEEEIRIVPNMSKTSSINLAYREILECEKQSKLFFVF